MPDMICRDLNGLKTGASKVDLAYGGCATMEENVQETNQGELHIISKQSWSSRFSR
jgi:hypothetical protein